MRTTECSPIKTVTLKQIDSLGIAPDYRHFTVGDEVVVRFKSGKRTIGRVISNKVWLSETNETEDRLGVLFFTGRGSKCKMLGGYKEMGQ